MNGNDNHEEAWSNARDQIANMSKLDFLVLLWEARIVGGDFVEAKEKVR